MVQSAHAIHNWLHARLLHASGTFSHSVLFRQVLVAAVSLFLVFPTGVFAAITFDNSGAADGSGTQTLSYPVSGSNTALIVGVATNQAGDTITGVTYNGVSLTRIDYLPDSTYPNVGGGTYCYGETGAPTGSHSLVVSSTGGGVDVRAVSYDGVSQTGFPDAHKTDGTNGTASTFTTSITTVASNDWAAVMAYSDHGALSAGTGLTLRTGGSATNIAILDSNGSVAAGSNSFTVNSTSGSSSWALCDVAFAPVSTPVVSAVRLPDPIFWGWW